MNGIDLRKVYLTQDNISTEAYLLWEREGKLDGHDKKHWFDAISRLEMAAEMDEDQLSYVSDMGRRIITDGTSG